MSLSLTARTSISPSATATPSALAARDRPIDFKVSRVATVAAARIDFGETLRRQQRALDLDEVNVIGSAMPASSIAARTPAATCSICAHPPQLLEWQRLRMRAADGERRRRTAFAFALPSPRSNTIQCGAMPPSVPPDMTRQIGRQRASADACETARSGWVVASPRLKSLTSPLPSVLPKMARRPSDRCGHRQSPRRCRTYRRALERQYGELWQGASHHPQ